MSNMNNGGVMNSGREKREWEDIRREDKELSFDPVKFKMATRHSGGDMRMAN